MFERDQIIPKLDVLASDRTKVGVVDHLDGERIKLARHDAPDGQHHYVPLSWVDHVDTHVHLNVPAATVFAGWPGRTASAVPLAAAAAKPNWLAWAALAAGLLALLLLGVRSCDKKPVGEVTETTTTTTAATADTMTASSASFNDDLKTYLASDAVAPRTFTFDKVLFDTASSAIKANEAATVDALATTLAGYPKAKVMLIGYTDARPVAGGNAQLGADRAAAVAKALEAKGIAADRIETATGGANDPAATNATSGGQAENRRTELVVTAK